MTVFIFLRKKLVPTTDLDSDLGLEDDEAVVLMDDFFLNLMLLGETFQ